ATTQASPPLLPGPANASTPCMRRSPSLRAISDAAAAPARCIRAREGVPAAMADASRAADSALVTTRTSGRTDGKDARLLVRGADRAAVAQLTVVDAHVETARRVAASPGFVRDR